MTKYTPEVIEYLKKNSDTPLRILLFRLDFLEVKIIWNTDYFVKKPWNI